MTYLAFDFGDGTTCASRFDNTLSEPAIPTIIKGQDEIWTNIAFDKNGENPVVGLRSPRRGYASISSNWKSKPNVHDEGWSVRRKNAVDFMRACFRLFLSNNPEYTDGQRWTGMRNGDPCKVVIGVPCDWSEEDVLEYKKMADEAGLPDVLVFKESQAAVLYARKFMAEGLPDEYLENGVLMIDIGSSTTDFTYIKGLRAAHCGLTLGAKYVEQAFLGDAMDKTGYEYFKRNGDEDSKKEGRNLRTLNLLFVRQWKENFFSAVQQNDPSEQTSPLPGSELKVGDEEYGQTYITPEFVNRCLDDRANGATFNLQHLSSMWKDSGMDVKDTWRGHFRRALGCVKTHWKFDTSELTIFVTGGASRMSFVEDDIKVVYGDNVRYFFGNDRERSFSVVKGLAWAAYATDLIDSERKKCRDKINTFLSVGHSGYSKVSTMLSSISSDLAGQLVSRIRDRMKYCPSLMNTKRKIENYARETVSSLIRDIPIKENVLSLASEMLSTNEMQELFADLQKKLGRANICARMPEFKIDGKVDLPNEFQVNLDLTDIVDKLIAAILWAVAFYLALPTFGLSLVAALFISAISEKGPDDPIDVDKIKKAADKVGEKKGEIENGINTAFTKSQHEISYRGQVNDALKKILLSVKQQELKALEGLFVYEEQ